MRHISLLDNGKVSSFTMSYSNFIIMIIMVMIAIIVIIITTIIRRFKKKKENKALTEAPTDKSTVFQAQQTTFQE